MTKILDFPLGIHIFFQSSSWREKKPHTEQATHAYVLFHLETGCVSIKFKNFDIDHY